MYSSYRHARCSALAFLRIYGLFVNNKRVKFAIIFFFWLIFGSQFVIFAGGVYVVPIFFRCSKCGKIQL